MAAERWIIFLILIVTGAGVYVVNSAVEEDVLREYSEKVADFNEQHHVNVVDNLLHPERLDEVERMRRFSGQGMKQDLEHPIAEGASAQVANKESPIRSISVPSSGQGINEEDPDSKGSNEKDENEGNSDHTRSKRSSGQGINEEKDISELFKTASRLEDSDEDDGGAETYFGLPEVDTNEVQIPKDESTSGLEDSAFEGKSSDEVDDALEKILANEVELDPDYRKYKIINVNEDFDEYGNGFANEESLNRRGFGSLDGVDEISSHVDNLNSYGVPREDDDDEIDHSQIGYLLLNSLNSKDVHGDIIKLNKGVDFILDTMNSMFSGEGELTLDLPDINKKFGHGILAGTFSSSDGFFKNPASLHRTGDVAVYKKDTTVGLEVALGLAVLDAGYEHYDLKILKIHQSGSVDVSVANNSIKMNLSLTYAPSCELTVDYLGLDQLDGIKVNITGLGAFQSMFDMLSKWLLDNFTGDLKNIVNKALLEKAEKAVAREDICKYFPQ